MPDPSSSDPITTPESSVSLQVKNLTVVAGEQTLLEQANALFEQGKITLVIGPSGVGKSVLMRIMAGLIEPSYATSIRHEGEILFGDQPVRQGNVGVVFQSFALFDELGPKANVQFARDHSQQHTDHQLTDLLTELKVPTNVRTIHLSGGQRQRLAIARALAFNSPAILYDEPTSGLDPENAKNVAKLIQQTHHAHQKSSVIVTHDYDSLIDIADVVYVLNPIEKKLQPVPASQWQSLHELLQPMAHIAREETPTKPKPLLERATQWLSRFLAGTCRGVEHLFIGLFSLLPLWKNFRWGLRYLQHYLLLIAGPTAWFYLIMAGLMTGFVTTYYIFQFLPYTNYIEPLIAEDLLSVIGFTLYRVFVPILATILIAARCGAAVTADIGSKQYSNQIDAFKTFGVSPRQYLLTPIMISFFIGVPFLTLLAFLTARLTSLVTFVITHPIHGPNFWYQHFHRGLHVVNQWWYFGSDWLLPKLLCCAVGTAVISYRIGVQPKHSSADVSLAVTRTILWSTLFVLAVHFSFAFYEFNDQVHR